MDDIHIASDIYSLEVLLLNENIYISTPNKRRVLFILNNTVGNKKPTYTLI